MKGLYTIARSFGALCLALSATQAAQAGVLYYSEDNNPNGLYTLDTTTGAATLSGSGVSGVTSNTVGLAPSADPSVLYASQFFNINSINSDGSGSILLGGASAEGLAFDPSSATLYGGINGSFFSISTTSGELDVSLAAPGSDVEGLAFGNGGIYGLDTNSMLKFYDIDLDSWSDIGMTGLLTGYNKGLAFDSELGILYAISGQDSNLYSLNANTGANTLIGNTGLNIAKGGLAFVSTTVPEPTSFALLGLGLAGIVFRRRKQNKAA